MIGKIKKRLGDLNLVRFREKKPEEKIMIIEYRGGDVVSVIYEIKRAA